MSSSGSAPGPDNTTRHACDVCSRQFKRPEHLKRHERDHATDKALPTCEFCNKRFSRSDSLQRHTDIHKREEGGALTLAAGRQDGMKWACKNCAKARVKCNGQNPCERCENESLVCETESRKRRRTTSHIDTGNHEESNRFELGETSASASSMADHPMRDAMDAINPRPPYGTNQTVVNPAGSNPLIQNEFMAGSVPSNENPHLRWDPANSQSITADPVLQPSGYSNLPGSLTDLSFEDLDMNWLPVSNERIFSANSTFPFQWPIDQAPIFQMGRAPDAYNPQSFPMERAITTGDTTSLQSNDLMGSLPGRLSEQRAVTSPPLLSDKSSTKAKTRAKDPPPESSYVDSVDGAREPLGPRKPRTFSQSYGSNTSVSSPQSDTRSNSLAFPAHERITDMNDLFPDYEPYNAAQTSGSSMLAQFRALCLNPNPNYKPFQSDTFVPPEDVSLLIYIYFQTFDQHFPLLHEPSMQLGKPHWLLTTSVAAVGSSLSQLNQLKLCEKPFLELLRRGLSVEISHDRHLQNLDIQQALLLCQVVMLASGDTELIGETLRLHEESIRAVRKGPSDPFSKQVDPLSRMPGDSGDMWSRWIADEGRNRLIYCVWYLNRLLSYQLEIPATFKLTVISTPLPGHENAWEADDFDRWQENAPTEDLPSLSSSLQILYTEKRFEKSLLNFSKTLLIHALLEHMETITEQQSHPLNSWVPTSKKIGNDTQSLPTEPVWLPQVPAYSRWRNATCDCLDVIHWDANSIIASNSNFEHPPVLHLHISRIFFLVPNTDIRRVAKAIVALKSGTISTAASNGIREWQINIWRWTHNDGHKARLAIIHAAAVFWHLRRYSAKVFYESDFVLYATLCLWAYATSTQNSSTSSSATSTSQPATEETTDDANSVEEADLKFAQIDRPCDDELVQLFVRKGDKMEAHVQGVGALSGPQGPKRILREGCKLMRSLWPTGQLEKNVRFLEQLAACDYSGRASVDTNTENGRGL